jgi:integrase
MKRVATKKLAISSLVMRFENLETLRKTYNVDLDDGLIRSLKAVEDAGCSAATLNAYRFVIKLWLRFRGVSLSKEDLQSLKEKSGERKRKITPKDLLSKDERSHIIRGIRSPAMRAYLAAIWDTGARPSELASMRVKDVKDDSYGFILNVQQTKSDPKPRAVRLLDPDSMAIFADWWAIHPCRDNLDAWLFMNREGNMLNVQTTAKWIRMRFNDELGRGKGQPKASLNLYLYRKSRITQLLKEKVLTPIEIKQRIGHSKSSNMLERYYAILDEIDQQEAELRYLGVKTEQEPVPMGLCPHCGAPNLATAIRCYRCRQPLSEKEMVDEQRELVKDTLRTLLGDPETLRMIVETVSSLEPTVEVESLRLPTQIEQEE